MSEQTYIKIANPLDSIDWQRSNAEILKSWLECERQWNVINHDAFWEDYAANTFDLRTANNFGLGVWAIILYELSYGVSTQSPDHASWGFGANKKTFNNGNFGINSGFGYNFTASQVRKVMLLKAFVVHMSGSVHGYGSIGINEALERIFGAGAIYCIDNRDMTFTYIVYDTDEISLINELYVRDFLPRPVGIDITVEYIE